MAPYRSREEARAPKTAPQTGLLADMVRQFADVHAFVRELVQNGIDAGATALDVRVDRDGEGTATVRVTDDGCGMTMAVVEDALLVLFRSTKDEDPTKIGKYGVGFMSVFAIEPAEVTVDTWQGGDALRVRLFPDHSYEIEHAAPRGGSGTSVTLSKTIAAEDFDGFWRKIGASLHRWCRHAEVPIHLTVTDAGSGRPARTARVDVPLDVRAVISVRRKFEDMEIVVGPIRGSATLPDAGTKEDDPAPFAGFYNRGLTLHETTSALRPGLGAMRVKVSSSRLHHTLSRDDVRRDEAFDEALARAEQMTTNELCVAVLREVAKEAEATGAAGELDRDGARAQRFAHLIEIATNYPVLAGADDLWLPLAHAVEGSVTMSPRRILDRAAERLGRRSQAMLGTTERTDLTAALAARGVPVVLALHQPMKDALESGERLSLSLAPVAGEVVLARELSDGERTDRDERLCAWLSEALAAWGIARVAIGWLPAGDERLGVLIPAPIGGAHNVGTPSPRDDRREHVVLAPRASLTGKWPKGALLVLRSDAEPVACARRAEPLAIGAHLLARYLLLTGPGLSSKASEALALRAISEIR
jgi:molecular chaperone HtpG